MISEIARPRPAPASANVPIAFADGITVRRAETLGEYEECLAVQVETWGSGFRELVPPAILMVAQKLGGVCAGAFAPDGRMLGFVFGITGIRDGRLVHWSDMLAVRSEARGAHIGERLKHYQRDLVRALGVETMYWTFDPLVARNAHLNLDRLGARPVEYVPDMYGSDTGSPLHGALATDRIVVAWDLSRAVGPPHDAPRPGVLVNPVAEGVPSLDGFRRAPLVRIAIPRDLETEPNERRGVWRSVTREAFLTYLGWGYEIVGFQRGGGDDLPYYELSPKEQPRSESHAAH
jgi:predicted GNAT superfamily acetyltransferase